MRGNLYLCPLTRCEDGQRERIRLKKFEGLPTGNLQWHSRRTVMRRGIYSRLCLGYSTVECTAHLREYAPNLHRYRILRGVLSNALYTPQRGCTHIERSPSRKMLPLCESQFVQGW